MKKLAIMLAGILAVTSLAACGNSNSGAASGAASGSAAASTPAGDNTLTMATNAFFQPYEYYEGEKIVGIDAEIGKAIADKLGMEFTILDMDFDSIITAVQTGKADMGMAGMTVTEDRLKNVDFSQSYATGVQVVIVAENSPIKTLEDLNGKKIGVQQGTTGDVYASAKPEDGGFGEEAVTRFNKGSDAVMALMQGKVDAVIIDNEPAKSFVAANKGLQILDTEYANEDYAIAFAKDNSALKDKVDAALGELIADGTVQSIVDKYISAK